ncbi:MAG: hypothetical protein NT027_16855 [Proteobacteria bacterium]|nr:hypothetical protein [Pseudomonadota bacterium]
MIKLLVAFILVTLSSCRTSREQNIAPGGSLQIKVMLNGVTKETIEEYQLTPKISKCADATGEMVSGTTYSFAVKAVKKGDVCALQLLGPKADKAGVNFFDSHSEGVYFEASSVTIFEEQNGALSAEAYLEKLFAKSVDVVGNKTFSVRVEFTGDATFKSTCTCRIKCAPNLINDAAVVQVTHSSNAGACDFVNAPFANTAMGACNQLIVHCDSSLYAGTWNPVASIDGSSGKANNLVKLTVAAAAPNSDGSVDIVPVIQKPIK